jgi:hypothetical protein
MPQEKPKTQPVKADGAQGRNKKLWQLYGKARELQRGGMTYQEVSQLVAEHTKNKYPGMASLENALGVGKPREGFKETLRANVATGLEGATAAHTGEIAGGLSGAAAAAGAMLPGGQTPQDAFGEAYKGRREQVENQIRSHQEEHPRVAALTEVAGAALPALLTAGGSATGSIGSVAQRGLAGAGRGMVGGAAGGAAYGHGAAEPGDRMGAAGRGALMGAAAGTAVGGILPFAGAGARKLGLGLLDEYGGSMGAKAATAIRDRGPARQIANAEMRGMVKEAETTPAAVAAKMRASPADEIIGAQDPSFGRTMRASRNTYSGLDREGGPTQSIMSRFMESGDRFSQRIRRGAGIPHTQESAKLVKEVSEELWRVEHLAPLREANPVFGDMRLRRVLKENEEIMDFLRNSKFFDGEDFNETGRLQYKAADDTIKRMKAAWKGGSHADDDLKLAYEAFEEILGDRVPEYSAAQAVWNQTQGRWRGYQAGKGLVNKSEDEILEAIRIAEKEGDHAVQALREGWMDSLEATLRNKETGGAVARSLELGSGDPNTGMINRLQLLFGGNTPGYQRFVQEAASDNRWTQVTRALTGNSTTPQQVADQLGGYITTKRAMYNEFLSVVFEDKEVRRRASKQIGELLARGDDAAIEEFLTRLVSEKDMMAALGREGAVASGMLPGIFSRDEAQKQQPPASVMPQRPPPPMPPPSQGGERGPVPVEIPNLPGILNRR